MDKKQELTHLSLFSGYGGLDIAAHWAGFTTVGLCEWADYPHRLLANRFPGVPIWRDIRTLNVEDFHAKTGLRTVDLVSGGFPCQPFSTAGSRRGTADDRYLWPEMLRLIKELRPTWVLGENVAGLLSMVEQVSPARMEGRTLNRFEDTDYYHGVFSRQEKMLFHSITEQLCDAGYEVQPFAVPACAAGAPHERMRVFLVGHAKHHGLPAAP